MATLSVACFLSPRLELAYSATARAAGHALGRDAELLWDARFEDLANGAVDAAFLCGLPYVELRERAGEAVVALAAPVPVGDRYGTAARYFSDVVVRDSDPARSLPELRGRRWAYNEEGSHSGHNVVLVSAPGVSGFLGAEALRTGSHEASLAAVRGGAADCAAVDGHLLDVLRERDPAVLTGLRTIATLGPSPSQPLAAGPRLGDAEREAIAAGVATMPASTPELVDARIQRWAPVGDDHYDPIRAMRRAVRAVAAP